MTRAPDHGRPDAARAATHVLLRLGLPRDPRAPRHLATFLVATAATVLLTRALLAATGYPQLGGDGLHIAHVLWGGLLMALAFLLLLSFAGPSLRPLGALVGGIGFGLFVDEVGKFVTSDNDYFYEPTAAIIYATVVVLGLVADALHGRRAPEPREALAGAVDEAVAGVAGGFTPAARRRAEAFLDTAGDVPGAAETRALLRRVEDDHAELPDPVGAVSSATVHVLHTLVRARFVPWLAVAVLVGTSGVTVGSAVARWAGGDDSPGWVVAGALLAGVASVVLSGVGLSRVRYDTEDGYRWFRRAVLVSLLVTQFFLFRLSQWDASWGLLVDLAVLGVVSAELEVLRRRREERDASA
ncbi:conserved hypothetical protein [Cellulomonas flavigena DSM 20109]|uniref:Uncharacterized protein n=1 Tax=Cellulomonas flavigena (strain ATCC 482 / DSM 20109 / BCRC 11376 / JCM 18109 / NBRC 3775 / NCIMB 8073 / NRS 134) TaxID=446466 RepID=D5UF08_CELFN|nr:hypothetical protein [Cellulomonas flavigena]ADG74818.1 conserved hypothetical protein [Cellulomonas flavigena DSM 20109]